MSYASVETAKAYSKAYSKAYYLRHKERIKAKTRAYALAHPEMVRKASLSRTADKRRVARKAEREKLVLKLIAQGGVQKIARCDAHVAVYERHQRTAVVEAFKASLNEAHVRVLRDNKALMYAWKYANDPSFALNERMRRQVSKKLSFDPQLPEFIRRGLKSGQDRSNRVEALLGYTITTLRSHLEKQFVDGMTWHGMSTRGWHVDHILPKKCFDVTTADGIRAYWSLSNLRPLWAAENLRKGARIEGLL